MTYNDFNTAFTDVVNSYLGKGYRFFTSTMGGSQGEIAKVDLIGKNDIIRIYADHHYTRGGETYEIIVGRVRDKELEHLLKCKDRADHWLIIWDDNLQEIMRYTWFDVSERGTWLVSAEEFEKCKKVRIDRFNSYKTHNLKYFNDDAIRAVMPMIKKLPKCKSVCIKDVENMYRDPDNNTICVNVRGHHHILWANN